MNACTGTGFEIRPLIASDAPAYKHLRDEALQRWPSAFVADYETAHPIPAQAYVRRFGPLHSGTFFLGAFDEQGPLLGCIGCERMAALHTQHRANIVGLIVTPAAQGQGLGRALLQACLQAAAQVPGLDTVTLAVTANNHPALHLYQEAGFSPWGRLENALHIQGQYFEEIYMARSLKP